MNLILTPELELIARLPNNRLKVEALKRLPSQFTPSPDLFAPVYYPHLNDTHRTQILYGGSSSGKSVFKAQQAVNDVLRGGRNWLICRKIGKDSRHSTFVEVNKVIDSWGVASRFKVNKTDLTITGDNGYQILFKGLDDLEKIKSIVVGKGAITDIWVEEATQTEADDIRQLLRRQRGGDTTVRHRLHLTFNPILQSSWIYTTYFSPVAWANDQTWHEGDNLTILKTTYRDNPFLGPDEIAVLENETQPYWRDVYTLGNWGILGDVIFSNWEVQDLSGMTAQFTNRRNGLDFGFSSDPAAVVSTHYDKKHKTIYVFGEFYERGLTNDLLAQEVTKLVGSDIIVCDSAEPKSIAELSRYGVYAAAAEKGKDSILHGIQWLQQQRLIIDKSCINTRNELQQYQWRKDKDGNALRQPVDKNNHIIDALRYAYESDSQEADIDWSDVADLGTLADFESKWR